MQDATPLENIILDLRFTIQLWDVGNYFLSNVYRLDCSLITCMDDTQRRMYIYENKADRWMKDTFILS